MTKTSAVTIPNMVTLTFHDGKGTVLKEIKRHNITCDAGRTSIAAQLLDFAHTDDKLGKPQFIGIGTGNTTPTVNDTALVVEVAREPVDPIVSTQVGTVITLYTEFPPALAINIEEMGLFVDSSATSNINTGTLLARSVLPSPEVKVSGQYLKLTWQINIVNC